MSLIAQVNRREIRFDHFTFIPEGQVVDGVTTAKNTWPDNTPTTNYEPFKLLELTNIKPFFETDDETLLMVSESAAGWTEESSGTVKRTGFTFDAIRTNGFYKMLEHGLATMPVLGTAQAPGADKRKYRDGMVLHESGDVNLGVITERKQSWARLELVSPGDHTNKTVMVQLRLTFLDADNNTFEMPTLA